MGVFLRSLLPLFSITALSLYALFCFAADDAPDALGCVIDDITGNYRCETGALAGREFLSREEAEATLKSEAEKLAKDKEDEAFAASYSVPLKLISWNFSTIGTLRFEYDRVAAVLAEADFAVLQEVEFNDKGESALTVISEILSRKTNQRICKGWFKNNYGGRARHAFIWKDKTVAYVEKGGAIEDRCPDAPVVIRIEGKKIDPNEPQTAVFYLKTRRQMFNVVSIQLEKRPKKAKEITAIFTTTGKLPWPAIVAGNFKLAATDKSFQDSTKLKFKPVMVRSGSATSNVWTKNLSIVRAEAVDLQERFSDLSATEVDKMVSSFPPILAEISFSAEEADVLRTQLVKRQTNKQKSMARAKKTKASREKPEPKPLPIDEDIEQEVGD